MSDELPDPFKTAKRCDGIIVRLRPEDLLSSDPTLDRESINRLMERHGGTLAAAMLAAGIEAGLDLLHREGDRS